MHDKAKDDEILDEYLHKAKIEHKHDVKSSAVDYIKSVSELNKGKSRHIHINYGKPLEKSIVRLRDKMVAENHHLQVKYSFRYLSIKLLENDPEIVNLILQEENGEEIISLRDEEVKRIESHLKIDVETAISDAKYGFIAGALKRTYTENKNPEKLTLTDKLDNIFIHKIWGYPIFILFLYIMFQATFTLGEYPMEWIENGVDWLREVVGSRMQAGPLKALLVEGVFGGVGEVIVFLPNILILYFFISLMEDTGYMSRAAFIMDKLMNKIGLHGKSFVPLIMGFGCNVPAIMATRTIEDRSSRLITILINPLMSCSARLPVYLLIAGAFFPQYAGLALFGIYMFGILLAIIVALLFKAFIFKKEQVPFVMELPPFRFPTGRAIWLHTWHKAQQYVRKMGTIILVASIVIWFLGYYPRPAGAEELMGEAYTEQIENSYLGQMGKAVEPVLKPLGYDWKISIALLSGVAAKEIVVSTLGVIYAGDPDDEDTTRLTQKLQEAKWEDGTKIFRPGVAIGLMIFVLIYFPCVATFVAIKNEAGSYGWAFFALGYSLVLAWVLAYIAQLIIP